MSKYNIAASYVNSVLSYDPAYGVFKWLVDVGRYGRIKAGSEAGGIDSNGYVLIRLLGHRYSAHRLAWFYVFGQWPKEQIDHINGCRSDNRIDNLRPASHLLNAQNIHRLQSNNTSGFMGVSWHKGTKRWVAQMWINRKNTTLGYFADPAEAGAAYIEAKRKHHIGCTI